MPNNGDPAPLFSGTDIVTHETFSLSEHQGETILVEFAGLTWCGPCQYGAPLLQELWEYYKTSAGSKIQFVIINVP